MDLLGGGIDVSDDEVWGDEESGKNSEGVGEEFGDSKGELSEVMLELFCWDVGVSSGGNQYERKCNCKKEIGEEIGLKKPSCMEIPAHER